MHNLSDSLKYDTPNLMQTNANHISHNPMQPLKTNANSLALHQPPLTTNSPSYGHIIPPPAWKHPTPLLFSANPLLPTPR